ncbi:hypothetical protein SacmaDRAFT_3802 [Saccharomonospora marina XMU15]|uniref:Uncharacterized protein n=1 Tax=Saccharomonospora marina XMU15 TaxID=882083 RepID=H5X1U2_9PSEU|nr:hypothetical protein SacmaDRAFT_3802 [Saccharomonospora marina XMU15]
MAENGGACVAVAAGADRVGPPLWQVFGPQQGRVPHKTLRQPVAENGGACVAVAAGADRVGPPLWQVFGPQQGRVSHKTLEVCPRHTCEAARGQTDRVWVSHKALEAPRG